MSDLNTIINSNHKRENDVDSTPSSILGHISVADMGTRVGEKSSQIAPKSQSQDVKSQPKNSTSTTRNAYSSNIASIEDLSYYPTTDATAEVLDQLMVAVNQKLTDVSHDTVVSATDVVLEILKNDEEISVKRRDIDELLNSKVSDVELNDMINLAKAITDYGDKQQEDDVDTAIAFEEEDDVDDVDDADESENDDIPNPLAIENGEDPMANEGINDSEVLTTTKLIPLAEISPDYVDKQLIDLEDVKLATFKREFFETLVDSSDISVLQDIKPQVAQHLLNNRWRIVFKTKYTESGLEKIEEDMESLGLSDLFNELQQLSLANEKKRRLSDSDTVEVDAKVLKSEVRKPRIVDLSSLVFDQGSHLMTTSKVKLPKGSYQQNKKLYDIVSVPAPEIPDEVREASKNLVPISELPSWAQEAFPSGETSTLNVIQSKIYPQAFKTDDNLLLCAPTGAGKTNVAMLTILRTIENFRTDSGIRLNDFKMVYIAPLKALVQEQMREFQRRLSATYGIVVNQLSGDSNLTKQQIMETQLLVVTPEKWDIITRKSTDLLYTNLVRLIIIDEIHLLHDERGPVLENIVSRTLRQVEATGENVRLVGLSATLPNYEDVARFLRVDIKTGLFFFNAAYRPCPLEQQFIGIKEKKAIKKLNAMNEACYDKLTDCMANNHQLIIFVHSRKETYKTANWLREKLELENQTDKFLGSSVGVKEILRLEAEAMTNRNLQEILPHGFGIHHAGLNKDERTVVEDLFAQGHIKCLVSTATLAWGVNLPAHTVVIKGTETYSPEKGNWVQLSPQDILQMLGRAGRPRYDKSGEGVIITSQDEIQYYLAILNQQLPIESQLMTKLADSINAEIVLGTVSSLEEVVQWLSYTYLYIRMLKSPALYHVGAEYGNDETLYYKRLDLAHSALTVLQNNKLVNYDVNLGSVKSTELGKISSHYYINYETMNFYNTKLKPWFTDIDILSIFASSGEFKFIPLRQEEKLEVAKLYEKCPIPIKEKPTDPLAKINILLQAYISRLNLEGFALMADMIYVTQSAGRLLRALHEICLRKNWASVSKVTLNLCKMAEKRMWMTNSPLRQFGSVVSREIIRATESSHLPFVSYFSLSAEELAEAINLKGNSRRVHELLQQFPKLSLSYYAQPLTHDSLRVQVEIIPDWDWNVSVHGNFQDYLVFVEDTDGDKLLFRDRLSIEKSAQKREMLLDFTVPLSDPVQPNYFITFINDKWLHSEFKIPLMISDLKIPKKPPSFTKLIDIEAATTGQLKVSEFETTFDFKYFNQFQSQAFQSLYNTNDNTFVGMSKGSGKTACAEVAILSHWKKNKGRILYLNPYEQNIKKLAKLWKSKYLNLEKDVDFLTGDVARDLKKISSNHLILSTPEIFDHLSKRWRQRKALQAIEMVICDDVHMMGAGSSGVPYENSVARLKLIASQTENMRFIALSNPLCNGRDFGDYLRCPKQSIYNFSPTERFREIQEIRIQGTNFNDNKTMILNTSKPCYNFLKEHSTKNSIVFVSTRREATELGFRLIKFTEYDGWKLNRSDAMEMKLYLDKVTDVNVKQLLESGIGIIYEGMNSVDQLIVERLFSQEILSMIIATSAVASYCPYATNVVILGTEEYDGKEHRYVNYSVISLLEMVGCCNDPLGQSKAVIYTRNATMNHYMKFLNEGIPLESFYNSMIHDVFLNEISTMSFKERQDCIDWLTFTYFYRRLQINPSFYDVKDTSHNGISEYLSDLVEDTLKDLHDKELIELEDEEEEESDESEEEIEVIAPQNGALIASHHNVSYFTMVELGKLDNKSRLRGILEVISSATEFEDLPLRINESITLERIHEKMPIKANNPDVDSPFFKVFVLLQAHFSRYKLPTDLSIDLQSILSKTLRIVGACVDTLSSEGYLNAVQAIDLSQMIVQGMWNTESPLRQLPHINEGILSRCKKYNVETVYDIMSLEDEERDDVLQLDDKDLEDVAEFVNKYPNVDISYEVDASGLKVNEPIMVTVNLERDEDMDDLGVVSSKFSGDKKEEWWIVIGDAKVRQLYGVKKTTISKEQQSVEVEVTIPTAGKHELMVWVMCDSYIDADKETPMVLTVDN